MKLHYPAFVQNVLNMNNNVSICVLLCSATALLDDGSVNFAHLAARLLPLWSFLPSPPPGAQRTFPLLVVSNLVSD